MVTTENPDRLLLLDPVKRTIIRDYDTKGKSPHMVILGPRHEWAYVSNTESATIAAIRLDSGETKLIPSGKRPQGGTLSRNGKRLYVVNSASGSITVIDTDRRSAVRTILVGQGPGRIELTPDGKTLVYNLATDQAVGFASLGSGKQTALIPLGTRPLSLTLSPGGEFAYVGGQEIDTVFVISVSERRIIRKFKTPNQAGPDPVLQISGS